MTIKADRSHNSIAPWFYLVAKYKITTTKLQADEILSVLRNYHQGLNDGSELSGSLHHSFQNECSCFTEIIDYGCDIFLTYLP